MTGRRSITACSNSDKLSLEPALRDAHPEHLAAATSPSGGPVLIRLFDRLLGKPTIDDFASPLIAAIRETGCADEFRYDRDESVIHQTRDGELVSQIHLGNQFRIYSEVALIKQNGQNAAAMADWNRVLEVAGHLLEETEDYPPRYRTRGFPDEAAIAAIGSEKL